MNFLKISFIFFSLVFLSGCFQTTTLLGPSVTVATTGNVLQAGLQYGANSAIKNETGKDTLEHLKDAVESQSQSHKFKRKFSDLVEKKFELTRQKLKLN
ncbi:hypothetical protein N9T17_00955 [Candidatus Pelagibacter sp.]|nr:hypothetical protein [Candidatus Pelagibacter sp.]|tara:strand:+ start:373 stop:669 length:297 start_codon:yes stop_codon:yes gene_type:complete